MVELLDAFSPQTGPEMSEIYIVYELMDYSMRDLFNMPSNDNLNLKNMVWDKKNGDYFLANVLFQLFCGLRYLHHPSLAVIHRDLKPENILFRRNNNRWLVKLCDWGLSRYLNEQETMDQTVYVVSYPYRAPEIIITGSYGFSADLWSIGCILGEMILGQLLFIRKTQNELIYRILYIVGFPEETVFPDYMTNDLQNKIYGPCRLLQLFPDHGLPDWDNNRISKDFIRWLIEKLMNYTPTKRITANDAAHLKQFDFLANYQGMDDEPEKIYVPLGELAQGEAAKTPSSIWKERITTALKEFQNERQNQFNNIKNCIIKKK